MVYDIDGKERMFRQAAARRRNLFGLVVERLGSRIVSGELKPGQTLPKEAELGQALGASRTVVREAMKSLAAKGLLVARTRTGTRVLPPTQWNLLDLDVLSWRYAAMPRTQFFRELFEIRRMIEPAAAALAAQRATDADLAALAEAYDRMQAVDHASEAAIDADLRFHQAILACTHNDLLLQMGGLIGVGLVVSFRISSNSYPVSLPLHRQVFEAIRDRLPERAHEIMEQLLSGTRDFLESELSAEADRTIAETASSRER
jgi:GntR family transcriptional regulator, galactonate operon transcriptional repressor